MNTDLTYFFKPRSVAIIGASDDPKSIRGRVLKYMIDYGFAGKVYPVSLTNESVQGLRAYKSVIDVPDGDIDVVVIAASGDQVPDILRDCAKRNVKFAVCYSSGFAEEGESGLERQQNLVSVAHAAGIRLSGPNSAGYLNVHANLPLTFTRSVDFNRLKSAYGRDIRGGVGMVAQSGGLGFAVMDRVLLQHGVGFSSVVSSGNEADLGAIDFAEYLVQDPDTKLVLLQIESFKDTNRFPALAAEAIRLGKPLIIGKVGTSEAGSRAATSHAGRMTGADDVYDAVLKKYGAIRVIDEEEMADTAAAFARCPLPAGKRVAIITTSGGAGVWMADACESVGLTVEPLDQETQKKLRPLVPSFGAISNPVDVTAQITLNRSKTGGSALAEILKVVHDSSDIDAVIMVANLSDGDLLDREQQALASVIRSCRKPLVFYSHAIPSQRSFHILWDLNIPCFLSTQRTARALRRLAEYAEFRKRALEKPQVEKSDTRRIARSLPVDTTEFAAKRVLQEFGIPIPSEELATSEDGATEIAARLGYPVALKIQSPDIPHKTDVGGIALGLKDELTLRAGYRAMMEQVQRAVPNASISGVLVSEMVPDGSEFIVGMVRDADFGPILVLGLGGIYTEIFDDKALLPLPVTRDEVERAIAGLRCAKILNGSRGRPAADVSALVDVVVKVAELVDSYGDRLAEIDLNPVRVLAEGRGVRVLDALLVPSK